MYGDGLTKSLWNLSNKSLIEMFKEGWGLLLERKQRIKTIVM